ncbi:AmmeMemoRadiSam system protein B [Mesorhizobium sp. ASY16-5R]|uniref:AmmeMemoRadiSam system protein B n=1 Tax=Mesorhizobium sp. ASY16-5R TaxID=3445772 RepID=UPI003F9F5ED7
MTLRSLLSPLIAWLVILLSVPFAADAKPACPPGNRNFPNFYEDRALFDTAIAKVNDYQPANERLTGIVVPHHLLADELVALGFKAASGVRYKRIVILSPDHFRASEKPFATATRGFETVFGPVSVDDAAARTLLRQADVEDSCLFGDEHGVQAMLPFIRHYFPEAAIVPVAISIRSNRSDWDLLADALEKIVDADTLVVESTDFSHYLPQHEARKFDQQTLNVLAAGSPDEIAALRQPQHADSVGALYIQTKLQKALFSARPLVIANESSQAYSPDYVAETTSYMVALFGRFDASFNNAPRPSDRTVYLAGDTNFGRAMKTALIEEGAAERIASSIWSITKGRPLVVNLEGVVLPNVPQAIDNMTLAMPEDLTLDWLRKLNVHGVGLANNHAMDLGASGYAETLRALKSAGIPAFGQGETLALGGLDIVGLSDLDTNASRQVDLLTPALLDRLVRPQADRPTVAFVHWGREYITEASERETMLADEMRLRSASLIVGAHPHVACDRLETLGGGDTLMLYSLGNFLFDQNAQRSSGAMLEVRIFPQGTFFARLIPLPNFFDMAKR